MTQQGNGDRIRLRVAFRNMFYTTIYVSVEGGFLADQGLDVDFSTFPPVRPAPTCSRPATSI